MKIKSRGVNYIKKARVLRRVFARKVSKQKADTIITEQVFDNDKFRAHVKETAIKMKIDEELAETIIKHHLSYLFGWLINPGKVRRRILLLGFFSIEVVNPLYNPHSIYNLEQVKSHIKKLLKFQKQSKNGK